MSTKYEFRLYKNTCLATQTKIHIKRSVGYRIRSFIITIICYLYDIYLVSKFMNIENALYMKTVI